MRWNLWFHHIKGVYRKDIKTTGRDRWAENHESRVRSDFREITVHFRVRGYTHTRARACGDFLRKSLNRGCKTAAVAIFEPFWRKSSKMIKNRVFPVKLETPAFKLRLNAVRCDFIMKSPRRTYVRHIDEAKLRFASF